MSGATGGRTNLHALRPPLERDPRDRPSPSLPRARPAPASQVERLARQRQPIGQVSDRLDVAREQAQQVARDDANGTGIADEVRVEQDDFDTRIGQTDEEARGVVVVKRLDLVAKQVHRRPPKRIALDHDHVLLSPL